MHLNRNPSEQVEVYQAGDPAMIIVPDTRAIIPARVRTPKDKPNAEGTVGNISTWITATLRNEQFFSLNELNHAIHDKLNQFNRKLFQKKEGSRLSLFLEEEKPLLLTLPATRFELSDWKTATVHGYLHEH